ncbi:MAG TPA: hypothetical protein VGJ26_20900, partial [Pirellulales bacterium]
VREFNRFDHRRSYLLTELYSRNRALLSFARSPTANPRSLQRIRLLALAVVLAMGTSRQADQPPAKAPKKDVRSAIWAGRSR